jgi:hypothetical protein
VKRLLAHPADVDALAARLADVPHVAQAETPHDDESPEWTLANSLSDIESACCKLVEEHLPRLVTATQVVEIESALIELNTELMHIRLPPGNDANAPLPHRLRSAVPRGERDVEAGATL